MGPRDCPQDTDRGAPSETMPGRKIRRSGSAADQNIAGVLRAAASRFELHPVALPMPGRALLEYAASRIHGAWSDREAL